MKVSSKPAQARRSFVRNVAAAALVAAPIVILPIMLGGSASATGLTAQTVPTGTPCVNGNLSVSNLNVGASATVTVALAASGCDYQQVTLVAYTTQGADYEHAGVQTLGAKDTKYVTSAPVQFSVTVPNCFFQIDLIYGSDTPATLAAHELYFTNHGTLIASYNGGTTQCGPTTSPTTTTTTTTSTTPTSSVTTSKPATVLPTTTTTTTATSSTSVLPTGTTTTAGSTTSSAAPSGTTTTTSGAVGGTSTGVPSSGGPTSVQGITFTQGPAAVAGTSLPFTGLPTSALVLLGIELLAAGTLVVLTIRRRGGGAHR